MNEQDLVLIGVILAIVVVALLVLTFFIRVVGELKSYAVKVFLLLMLLDLLCCAITVGGLYIYNNQPELWQDQVQLPLQWQPSEIPRLKAH